MDVRTAIRTDICDVREKSSVDENVVDLCCCSLVRRCPGGFVDVFPGEERASNHHSSGGCKVDAPLAVVVRDGV